MRKAREKVNSKGAQWEIIIGSCQGWGRGANSVISCEVGRIPLRISPQNYKTGLPWWFSGKESACQCKRHRFDPQFGKILYAAELSLCATTTEPMHCNYWSPHILEPVSATRKATVIRSPSIAISKEHPAQSEKKKKILQDSSTSFWLSEEVRLFLFLVVLGLQWSVEALHRSAQPSLATVHWLSCPTAFGILVPLPGIESTGFITSGPPEKSQVKFNGPTFPDSTYSQSPKWRR